MKTKISKTRIRCNTIHPIPRIPLSLFQLQGENRGAVHSDEQPGRGWSRGGEFLNFNNVLTITITWCHQRRRWWWFQRLQLQWGGSAHFWTWPTPNWWVPHSTPCVLSSFFGNLFAFVHFDYICQLYAYMQFLSNRKMQDCTFSCRNVFLFSLYQYLTFS